MSPKGENDNHFFTLAICTMGDQYYRPLTTGKKASEVFTRHNRLLHKMGGSRSTSNNYRSKGTKFCLEKYCMQVRDPKDDHL